MKHFPSNFASIVRQKMTVILVALAVLGLVGSVSTSIRSVPPAYAASRASSVSAPASTSQSTSITDMIYQVFGSYGAGAVNVATCESGLNPDAYNPISIDGSHAAGLFQILYPSTWEGTPEANSSPYDAWANIQAAHAIFVRDGYSWREWTCQP